MCLEIVSAFLEERVLDINMMENLPSSLYNHKYKDTLLGKLFIIVGRIMKRSFLCNIQWEYNLSSLVPHSLKFMAS